MPFIKGQSGNPKGRKRGALYKYELTPSKLRGCRTEFTEMAHEKFRDWAPKVIEQALQMASEGNEKMIMMLWDKFFDHKFHNKIDKPLTSENAADIAESVGTVIQSAGRGEIDTDYALGLIKALAVKQDSIIVKELEGKVNEIVREKKNQPLYSQKT